MYPLLFSQNRKTLVWGTEDWIVSGIPGSESVISHGPHTGMLLTDYIAGNPAAILGHRISAQFGGKMPLLVKIIDARQDLSIQVHPDDEMARRVHGKMGKSEMWYILSAEPGAFLYAGFSKQITPDEYRARVADITITEVLARHEVHPGDVFYLPAGRVHAIGGGIRLAEVQQSSDITYRIYDYGRPGLDGKPRELHTELAAQAIDYSVLPSYRTDYELRRNHAETILDTSFFSVTTSSLTGPIHRRLLRHDSFVICVALRGNVRIKLRNAPTDLNEAVLREGQACFIPAAVADYDLEPMILPPDLTLTSPTIMEAYI